MKRKIRHLLKMYPMLSLVIIAGTLALGLSGINSNNIAHLLLFTVSAAVLVPAIRTMNQTLKNGYYGINLLPLTSLLFALILKHYWTAFVLALIICGEKPLVRFLERKHDSETELSHKSANPSSLKHAPIVRLLDRYSVPFTILVILLGGAVWVVTGDIGRFLEITAIASTTPLLLAPSVALLAGLNQALSHGIYVKSASLFERLGGAGSVVLSRTGVLTTEHSEVQTIKAYGSHAQSEVLQVAAALAADSVHHLAQAIVIRAESIKVNKAKHAREVPGQGIAGRLRRGQSLYIGRLSFLAKSGVRMLPQLTEPPETVLYVGLGEEIIGHITFSETLLPGAKTLISRLKKLGLGSIILASGAANKSVSVTAKQTGISDFKGDCSAADKISSIERAHAKPVVFVGDAVAESACLTAADVSITYDQPVNGSADVIISDYSTDKLADSFLISRRSLRRAQTVSILGLFITLLLVVAASSGIFTTLQSSGLQAVTMIVTLGLAGFTKKLQTKQ
ncbi:HAD family hydrolase [Candidatus Saccharibacteria bacterium]|nr:HAD family hydrolase [Candidatus Saccharibacteria bacterium]